MYVCVYIMCVCVCPYEFEQAGMAEKLKVNKREDLIRMLTDTVSIAIPIDKEVIFELMYTYVCVCVYTYVHVHMCTYVHVCVTHLQSKDELRWAE